MTQTTLSTLKGTAPAGDFLSIPLYGIIKGGWQRKDRQWCRHTLKEWLNTPPAADAECDRLAALAGTAAEDATTKAEYRKAKGRCAAFQYFHAQQTCEKTEVDAAQLTGIYAIDIDHLPAESVGSAIADLLKLPYIIAVGKSVSRRGLAAIAAYTITAPGTPQDIDARCNAGFHADIAKLGYDTDTDAKNPVRWRVCLQNAEIKGDAEEITPLEIPLHGVTQQPTTAPHPDHAPVKITPSTPLNAAAYAVALDKLRTEIDGNASNAYLKGAVKAGLLAGVDGNEILHQVRDALATARPDSSRLEPGKLECLLEWTKRKLTEKAAKPQKVTREDVIPWFDNWQYDTFSNVFVRQDGLCRDANGSPFDLDTLPAMCARETGCTATTALELARTYVKNNPARQFDGLKRAVYDLAGSYAAAEDAGAIDELCNEMQLDAYEARRLRLWIYQICGKAVIPGEKTDGCLILVTQQEGFKKTSFFDGFAAVLGNGKATVRFPTNKDTSISLCRHSIALIDEIDKVLRKADVAELKELITETESNDRAPYDADEKTRKRRAVFCATSNSLTPLPTGEGDARRYWVINPKARPTLTTNRFQRIMREAAHDVIAGIEAAGGALDRFTTTGKVWVQTDDEERETVARNKPLKAEDSATIAIQCGLRRIAKAAILEGDKPKPLGMWAAAFETGDAKELLPGYYEYHTWVAPRASAPQIARLIKDRCTRVTRGSKKDKASGYTASDLLKEFLPDAEADEYDSGVVSFPCRARFSEEH